MLNITSNITSQKICIKNEIAKNELLLYFIQMIFKFVIETTIAASDNGIKRLNINNEMNNLLLLLSNVEIGVIFILGLELIWNK